MNQITAIYRDWIKNVNDVEGNLKFFFQKVFLKDVYLGLYNCDLII